METLKAPDTTRGEMTRIGKSVVIKGELSCSEDLYIDGQVEGTIDPEGNRLTIGPNGSVNANALQCFPLRFFEDFSGLSLTRGGFPATSGLNFLRVVAVRSTLMKENALQVLPVEERGRCPLAPRDVQGREAGHFSSKQVYKGKNRVLLS